MKKYPEYRESGSELIDMLPTHWRIVPLTKYLNSIIDYRGRTPKKIENGGQLLVTARNIKMGRIDYSLSEEYVDPEDAQALLNRGKPEIGDVLFTTEAPLGEVANVDNVDIALAQRIVKFSGKKDILDNFFLKYWILSHTFQNDLLSHATGSTAKGIKASKFNILKLVLPTYTEQKQISLFLDIKTVQIDSLIQKKKQMIELLKEERAAIINQAVTKGINPDAEMKDSGIKWLGEVPKHWGIKRVKHVLDFYDSIRKPLSSDERGKMQTKQYDYYGASGIIDKVDDYLFEGEYILVGEDGANLLSRSTPLAFKACGKFWVNNHAHILKPKGENILAYYVHLLETLDYTVLVTGSAQPKLTQEALGNQIIIEPTIKDQISIVEFIKDKEKKILSSILHIEKELALIEEYRTALINEAVTGKIKVTESV